MPVALAAILALAGVALLSALAPHAPSDPVAEARSIAADLRCPDCQALSVAESRTASATAIREQIARLLAEGRSPQQIRQHFVDRYGEWILLAPANPLVWILPVVALLAALGGLAWWLVALRTRPSPSPRGVTPLSADQRRRLDEEMEQLDG